MVMGASAHDGEVLTDRDRQRAETRKRVRQVALDVIRREGLAEARIDEIARVAGVSRGTVYFHYPTKEHVVGEVFAEAEARVAAALDAIPRAAPVARVLEVFCAAYAREWEREAQLFPAVATVALQRAATAIRTKEYDAVHSKLAVRFRVAAERGELTGAMHAGVLANVFLTNVLAATLSWCGRSRPRLATVLGAVVEVFLNGACGTKK